MSALSRLTWIQRITLILFATVVLNQLMAWITGYSLLGGDFFIVLFIASVILLGFTLVRPLMRKVVWRVRNRLFVTYFLIGALPLALLLIIVFISLYMLLSQSANYLLKAELDRRIDEVHESAQRLAQNLSDGRKPGEIEPAVGQAVVRTGKGISTIPPTASIADFPPWKTEGFKGIARTDAGGYFLAAFASAGAAERVDVFAYRVLDDKALSELLPGLVSVQFFGFQPGLRGTVQIGRRGDPNLPIPEPLLDSSNVVPDPEPKGFWDADLDTALLLPVRSIATGDADTELFRVYSRPSVILPRLFSTWGQYAFLPALFLLIVAGIFVAVELVAIISSAQLTRSITRTVHDLYVGTKRVEAGDFGHQITVRTKDQLSELATSFNTMTRRIAKLIDEVKDKEKFEAELEIARQVQAQLFPREVPILKTLELGGLCNPARVVSGDYYDFVPVDIRSTALVIGDISGKGISAALLMASVQSSLRAQLRMGANGTVLSTATLVSRLNRQLFESTPPEKYATFYCGFYDDENGRLSYTNAGHLAPILIRRQSIIRLESNGLAVGLFPDSLYEQNVVDLEAGDLLTAFTDGITESENAKGEQFGDQRLTELLMRHRERPLDEIMRAITEAVRGWASNLDDQDDTTMLLARRL